MNWSGCELVEVIPGKHSGDPLIKGTRIPADAIVSNFDSGSTLEEILRTVDSEIMKPFLERIITAVDAAVAGSFQIVDCGEFRR